MKKIFIYILILFISLTFFSETVFASDFILECGDPNLQTNQEFDIRFMFMSGKEPINALEGLIEYNFDKLELISVNDAQSIIPLWIEKGLKKPGSYGFAGVIPGGYGGLLIPNQSEPVHGPVFTMHFRANKSGDARVALESGRALIHDGEGTEDTLMANPCKYQISYEYMEKPVSDGSIINDHTQPLEFSVDFFQDENVENGAWMMSFVTRDNESGMDHYEIKEGVRGFRRATSPYRLLDQNRSSEIFIKAIDRAGNERILRLGAQGRGGFFEKNAWYAIILIAIIFLIVFAIRLRRNNAKSKK